MISQIQTNIRYNRPMTTWPAPPFWLVPLPGQAHIFRLPLDLPEARLEALRPLLDEAEQARAARYLFERDRRRFIAARGQVRQILGFCLERRPEDLRFSLSARGKPSLDEPTCLRFNLSHSRSLGLLVVCAGQDVGIDLEAGRDEADTAGIARRFFTPGEAARLQALPEEQHRAAFYTCWTRKEAYLKGRGEGLAVSLSSFEVSFAPGEPPQVFTLPERTPDPDWRLYDLRPGQGFAGALAVRGQPVELFCWDWPGAAV